VIFFSCRGSVFFWHKNIKEYKKIVNVGGCQKYPKIVYIYICLLLGGLEHEFYIFHSVENVIIPTDELIFFRGVGIPQTRKNLNI